MNAKRAFRLATLLFPSWGAWYVVVTTKDAPELVHTVALALGPLWALLVAAIVLRLAGLAFARNDRPSFAQIDVLTGSGAALGWSSALAIVAAVKIGYASLAVIGVLGTAVFHLVVVYTLLALRGSDPMRARATITRRFSPDGATEGDDIVEAIRFDGTRIPMGFRLFVTGRVGPRWATSRHVLDTTDSGGEVVLESEIGPALRGEHDAEPLEVWLEDTFGLCRSVRVSVGATHLTVLPRVPKVDEVAALREHGIGPRAPRQTPRLPSEGLFNMREYQQGDDVRRIHWVRSLAAGELIVRLPDEVPPDRPHVRLVLDTYFPEALVLGCDATAELLDALVDTWLGVGRALVESGVRVSLVAAVPRGEQVATRRIELARRDPGTAQRLGATIEWQGSVQLDDVLTDEATFVVTRAVVGTTPRSQSIRWIVVIPEIADVKWTIASAVRMPYPMGSADNRWSRWRKASDDLAKKRFDQGRAMLAMRTNAVLPPRGSLAALPQVDGTVHIERIG